MTTQLVRVPLAWPIGTRSGTSLLKDPYIRNGVLEKYGDKMMVAKRPGTSTFLSLGGLALSQAATYYNGFYYGICGDVLFRNGGVPAASTGAAWTQSDVPTWPATERHGACVFNNRMWMLGGVTSSAGIWSSVDGVTWTVNAGGQPWGFRTGMVVVVLNDKMLVLGGFNTTLHSCFNDVWESSDGANWTQISADGAGSLPGTTPWSTRTNHGGVATANGVYIMGGEDLTSFTVYGDVWYSPTGVSDPHAASSSWAQLTALAPFGKRSSFSCLYFDNKIWVIGGIDSLGNVLNDVWSSPDGITWTRTTNSAFSDGRFYSYACVYLNKMWMIGGTTASGISSQVYSSDDGINWTLVTASPGFSKRTSGQALVFRTPSAVSPYNAPTMWLLGGDNGTATLREVWRGNLDATVFLSMSLVVSLAGDYFQFNTFLNNTRLLFKNSSDFFVFDGYMPVRVTDSNYPPETVPGIVTLNGRVYVMTPQGEIHGCSLENPALWPALDFVTADYEDDAGVCLAKYLNYVVAFGTWTTQFFYDNGANQPVGSVLAPYINANLRVGCVSAQSVATCGNGLYWVGQGDQGARGVYQFNGLNPQKVSTPYVDRILMAKSPLDMIGIPAICDGREYYIIKTGIATALAYDITNREWYEWDTFPYIGYVTNFQVNGDYLYSFDNNKLVHFSPTAYTDVLNGNFTLLVQTDKQDGGITARKFFGSAVLVGDLVTGPTPTIAATDDDYNNTTTFGTVKMSDTRPRITRLGSARRRSWKVSQTDNYAARFEALEVEFSVGES